jgi:hypothetical protein
MKVSFNNKIVLEDFYKKDQYYLLDIPSLQYSICEKYENNIVQGFLAKEKCGLLHKKEVVFALFYYDNEIFILIDQKLFSLQDIKTITFSNFILFIEKFELVTVNNETFYCKRWSRDVDEFFMNHFLYFLHYSYKQDFANILQFRDTI